MQMVPMMGAFDPPINTLPTPLLSLLFNPSAYPIGKTEIVSVLSAMPFLP